MKTTTPTSSSQLIETDQEMDLTEEVRLNPLIKYITIF